MDAARRLRTAQSSLVKTQVGFFATFKQIAGVQKINAMDYQPTIELLPGMHYSTH